MGEFQRSRSYANGERMQIDSYYGAPRPLPHDFRSYSVSYVQTQGGVNNRDLKLKKGKSISGSISKSWSFGDPELQRKKRVASYKMYSVEGKVKRSLRNSFRWLKNKYSKVVYGVCMARSGPKTRPGSEQFMGYFCVILSGLGSGVGAGGEEQEAAALSILCVPWLAFVVFILFILLNAWLRICKRHRREQEMMEYDVVEEIIYGLESGILFGMASVISKMGFLFLEQGFPSLLVPMCIIISVFFSGAGLFYQTRGLKHGRAIIVSTCAAVASILTGVLAGMLALGERLPSAPKARFALLLGWLLIIVGVVLLVGSKRLVRFLRVPSRRVKNYGTRRAGTSHIKEPSPTAVVQAATLNHLLSSTSKEKA
ncbi:hypothetical protein Ahy_A07g033239 isoform D [Arachis hypogaea]|uniref:Uncharacterized protein n=1 Tax=Arachis hypogaea TaxID=3818 RepID=A0A445C8Q1_ARAHY|nr:hypothetical protein Ahy_A07g033239 isoform D [Arachis hypogaea]